jgi:hypothetical protein
MAGGAGAGAGSPSPLEVARAFYGALHGGDAEGAAKLVGSPFARPATDSFVKLANAYRELELAVGERFGAEAARTVGYRERIAAEEESLSRAKAQVKGEEAIVTAGEQTLATLHKVNGAWRVLLEEALATERGVAGLMLEAEASLYAARRVAPAIRQGLFNGPEDALEAFRNEVTVRMQGAEPDLPREAPRRRGICPFDWTRTGEGIVSPRGTWNPRGRLPADAQAGGRRPRLAVEPAMMARPAPARVARTTLRRAP